MRLGADLGRARWELELVHHKLYLQNPPPEVQAFQITHGFNFITLNRRWPVYGFGLRAGAGIVLAHPQTTIRGRAFPENGGAFGLGWYVSGPAAQVGLERRIRLNPRFDAGWKASSPRRRPGRRLREGMLILPTWHFTGLRVCGITSDENATAETNSRVRGRIARRAKKKGGVNERKGSTDSLRLHP